MLSSLRRKLAELRRCTSGNAMMMTAFGMPALIGAAGFGVDTAQWYMWQRELQHSADQAAIGGAWALAYDEDADYVKRAEQEYYANINVTDAFDDEPDISLANYDGGVNNSVLVTASVTYQLPFTGFLLQRSSTISVVAQAAFKKGASYNACLFSLKKTGTTFTVGGTATVDANCGLGALSCSDGAIDIGENANIITTSIVTCGTVTSPEKYDSVITENAGGLEDEYEDLPIPEPEDSTPSRTYACTGNGQNKKATLQPGKYAGGIKIACNTTLASGIYFIDGGVLDLSHNASVVGNNVMFVLRKGATMTLGGQGNSGGIVLTPMQAANFVGTSYADDADRLAGMLVIEDKTGVTSTVNHTINGNSDLDIEGVLYLPNGEVTVNGDSESTSVCFQLSAYTLKITGTAYLRTLCEYDDATEIGTAETGVRLIA